MDKYIKEIDGKLVIEFPGIGRHVVFTDPVLRAHRRTDGAWDAELCNPFRERVWTGKKPPPKIGEQVRLRPLGGAFGRVTHYFEDRGFLGVVVNPDAPLTALNRDVPPDFPALVFGVELIVPATAQFAHAYWTAEDVRKLRPQWTEEEADRWLADNADELHGKMIEAGWAYLEANLED